MQHREGPMGKGGLGFLLMFPLCVAMKSTLASNAKAVTTTVVENVEGETMNKEVDLLIFSRNSDDLPYEIRLDLAGMPSDAEFKRAVIKAAWNTAVYRSPTARKAILAIGLPFISWEHFRDVIVGITYRGDETPNKADKTTAALFWQALESKVKTAEAVAAWFTKAGIAADVSSLQGLELAFMNKRLAEEQSAEDLLNGV